MPTKIFLSYGRDDDEPFVRRLYDALRNEQGPEGPLFDVWFDRACMPSRGVPFLQEVRDVIAYSDRLVLVVGPDAMTSQYVRQEWRFAYFEAGCNVNPIVRCDGRDEAGANLDAYTLVPSELALIHAEDFRRDDEFGEHLAHLVRQLSEPLAPLGKLVAVPELPPHFCEQPERIAALRELVLADLEKPTVVSGAAARVGLQGMGGIGKSVLASALAHRPEVRRAFPDGVYWVTVGQNPNVRDLQQKLVAVLGGDAAFESVDLGKERLRELLKPRHALLVLDDVWVREHAEPFNVVGACGRLLMTTRDASLVRSLTTQEHHFQVQLPTEAESALLLAGVAGLEVSMLPAEANDVIALCGRLPLALALCGGMLASGTPWGHLVGALREHDLEFLSSDHPGEEQHRNVWVALDVSLRALPADLRERFAELAVFALDRPIPEAAIATLWKHSAGLLPRAANDLLRRLTDRALVTRQGAESYMLHDLVHNFATGMATKQAGSWAALHQRLLDAYAPLSTDAGGREGVWEKGPNDGYFFESLCGHLLGAGRLDDAVTLLTDLPWVEAKCAAKLVFSLQDDYQLVDHALPERRDALREERDREARTAEWTRATIAYASEWSEWRARRAAGALAPEPTTPLPTPVPACRMWTDEEIAAESERILRRPTRADRLEQFARLVRAEQSGLSGFGDRPGFVVQQAMNREPEGLVHDAAVRRVYELDSPWLERQWPTGARATPNGACLLTLEGHGDDVVSLAVTADGRRAVSASEDKTVRVWDVEAGVCLRTWEGQGNSRTSVALTADGRRMISSSWDGTLRVWDVESGISLCTLEGNGESVTSVAITADGRCAVSASLDGALRVWDVESGRCVRELDGHGDRISSVVLTADGRCALSASWSGTLCVWDVESGRCVSKLEGHSDAITSLALAADGRRAVSASVDKSLRLWDVPSGTCLRVWHGERIRSVALTADGRRVVLASLSHTMSVWDMESGGCLRKLEWTSDSPVTIFVTADGRRAVSADGGNALRVWDVQSGASLGTWDGHRAGVMGVAMAADGRSSVSASWDKTLRTWDVETGKCLRVLEGHRQAVMGVAMTADGRHAVSASLDETLRVWDVKSGSSMRTLKGHGGRVSSVALTANGRRAVSGSYDQTLKVWNVERGKCLSTIAEQSGLTECVALAAEGRLAVTANIDRTLRVWDVEAGTSLRTLQGHSGTVRSVALTADGRLAVSASDDRTVRLWNVESAICLRTLAGHSGGIRSVALSASGRLTISTGDDQTLRVWHVKSGACLVVCHVGRPVRAVAIDGNSDKVVLGAGREVRFYALHEPVSA